jgi:lactate permease
LLSVAVLVWGLPPVRKALDSVSVTFEMPFLHERVAKGPQVDPSGHAKPEAAAFKLAWLSASGTGILLAAAASSVWLGIGPRRFAEVFGRTLWQLRFSAATIVCMLALGYVTKYSGQDVTLGLALTATGAAYPFFSAMLGWLGVALTGSDTSSNVLFGNLQKITAHRLSAEGVIPLPPAEAATLLCTANSTGGVMGKMIDAQSLVVAAAATGIGGREGTILRAVFLHSIILAAMVGGLVAIQAYWWTAAVPSAK